MSKKRTQTKRSYSLTIPERLSIGGLIQAITKGTRDQFTALDAAGREISLTKIEMDSVGITQNAEGQLFIPATLGDYRRSVEFTPLAIKTMTDVLTRLESEGNLDRRLVDAYDVLTGQNDKAEPAPETGKDTEIKFLDEEKPPPPAE
jgi:hypothetical protein